MQHEAFDKDGSIRVWSVEVREALRELMKEVVAKLNAENMKSEKWDRKSNRFTMDGVKKLWENYHKNSRSESIVPKDEEKGIKLRQTTFERTPHEASSILRSSLPLCIC